MRRNGFTLVEMMTVIVILVTLSVIAIFSITGIVNDSTEKLYQLQIKNIIDASRTYAVKNNSILADNNEITLCDLKRSSLLEEDLKNPRTEKEFDNSLIVKITRNDDGDFDFLFDGISKMENYSCDLDIAVLLNGGSPLYVKLGDNHDELGVTVKRKNQTCQRGDSVSNETNCYYTLSEITGSYKTALTNGKYSKVGTYTETYTITSGNFSSAITRTIVIQDKTPPVLSVNYGGTIYHDSFSIRILEDNQISLSCIANDQYSGNLNCITEKDNYNYSTNPGTYEIVYKATDASGNTASLLVDIIVLPKNKDLLVGVRADKVDWTNEPVILKAFPLYSKTSCNYQYTFNGFNWDSIDTKEVSQNSTYRIGIKCLGGSTEDYMLYKVSNIDFNAPSFGEFGENASVVVSSLDGNFTSRTKDGKRIYYSTGSVSITNPSGAIDNESGVAGYEIYVNDELFSSNTLTGDGKYEIKIKAYDYAGNYSNSYLVSYVIISSAKPVCEFLTCDDALSCGNIKPIFGDEVIYDSGFKITSSDFSNPKEIKYKFKCSYEYFDGEEDIFATTNISEDKFEMKQYSNEMSETPVTIDVESITNDSVNTVTTCLDGKCIKNNYYVVALNVYSFTGAAKLYIKPNALCDRISNCNLENASMILLP